jgi:hypothetical protein
MTRQEWTTAHTDPDPEAYDWSQVIGEADAVGCGVVTDPEYDFVVAITVAVGALQFLVQLDDVQLDGLVKVRAVRDRLLAGREPGKADA